MAYLGWCKLTILLADENGLKFYPLGNLSSVNIIIIYVFVLYLFFYIILYLKYYIFWHIFFFYNFNIFIYSYHNYIIFYIILYFLLYFFILYIYNINITTQHPLLGWKFKPLLLSIWELPEFQRWYHCINNGFFFVFYNLVMLILNSDWIALSVDDIWNW